MAHTPSGEPSSPAPDARPLPAADAADVSPQDFRDRFGEDLLAALDVETWSTGWDLAGEYPRIAREVRAALRSETDAQRRTREHLFPLLRERGGGVYDARREVLEAVHQGLLVRGGVEACDGTVAVHDTLPLTVYQIGVSLVSYRGDQGTWHQRLFRRDLREPAGHPVPELAELLERR